MKCVTSFTGTSTQNFLIKVSQSTMFKHVKMMFFLDLEVNSDNTKCSGKQASDFIYKKCHKITHLKAQMVAHVKPVK